MNKEMKQKISQKNAYPTGNDNPSNNRDEGNISKPSLPLQRHQVGENRREERRRSADGLVKTHRQEPQGDVPEHHRHAKDQTQGRDLQELDPRSNRLHGDHLHPCNRDVAQQGTSRHVAHGQEDWVFEAVIAQQILVQQQDTNVGRVPGCYQPDREESRIESNSRLQASHYGIKILKKTKGKECGYFSANFIDRHSMLDNQLRHATLGPGIALVAFDIYMVGEQVYNMVYAPSSSHHHQQQSRSH
ncbi:hypothetical protein GQ457_14G024560 [Hibiscus cannabinus]